LQVTSYGGKVMVVAKVVVVTVEVVVVHVPHKTLHTCRTMAMEEQWLPSKLEHSDGSSSPLHLPGVVSVTVVVVLLTVVVVLETVVVVLLKVVVVVDNVVVVV